jgi:hypothetical protein
MRGLEAKLLSQQHLISSLTFGFGVLADHLCQHYHKDVADEKPSAGHGYAEAFF